MQRVPKILGCDPLHRVTFSQTQDLARCRLKGVIRNLRLTGEIPKEIPRRAALVGKFHHLAMEWAMTAETLPDLERRVESEIKRLQSEVETWAHLRKYGSVSGWPEINQSVSRAIRGWEKRGIGKRPQVVRPEAELQTDNGIMVGRPDYYQVDDGLAILKEYKSSTIRSEDGYLQESYKQQVLFYATLLFDRYNVRAVLGTVESLSGDSVEVNALPADGHATMTTVAQLIDSVNREVLAAPTLHALAQPADEICSFCAAQVFCIPFKTRASDRTIDNQLSFLEGRIERLVRSDARTLATAVIFDSYRKRTIELNMPISLSGELAVGKVYAFQDVLFRSNRAIWSAESRVFVL
jgi:hypothetical protein